MSPLDHAYATRETVLQRLEEDLFGGPMDAELTEPPMSRFIAGILYPDTDDSSDYLPDSVDHHTEEGYEKDDPPSAPDAPADPGVSLSHVRYPRSMGMTFAVDAVRTTGVTVGVSARRYEPVAEDRWRRTELPTWEREIGCSTPGSYRTAVAGGLDLRWVVREARDGVVAVTLSLVNTDVAPRGHRDERCWFNPVLIVTAPPGTLRERPPLVIAGTDEDDVRTQRLLYRGVRTYAVGHGCAVQWPTGADGTVTRLTTTFMPRHELLLADPGGAKDMDLSMKTLGGSDDFTELDRLVDHYESWISRLATTDATLNDEQRKTLRRHIEEAGGAARRMREGIDLLRADPDVRKAFRLMNEAMSEQRSRQEHHRGGGLGGPPTTADAGTWYPFQIAFILLNLVGLADPEHEDREIADLLWFPTGGGKTEAYLGIIGVAILLRRIRNPHAAGVSVLMRYTLRLLTLQQYQRATGLICALEALRKRHLPDCEPISIGLWVGQASTPNSIDDARRFLNKARTGVRSTDDDDTSDPVQLRQCPWCGHPLDHQNYEIVDRSWMKVACGQPSCAYRNGLPVHIIDEDVYRARPSLLIATVDKFAMLPWKRESGRLLGTGIPTASPDDDIVDLPPDIIVQDELHLISGPLGTIVGLYETAVDAICGRDHRPKIVASTATIRRATDQVRAVFARRTRQFPPPGLDPTDSFFAVEASRDVKATREYVGLMAPGASHATLMVRVYASLMQSASTVPEDDEAADLYWTLLGYFNSLRVLGGAYIQVLDDVPDQVKVVARRRGEEPRIGRNVREMTSRLKSTEIPVELKILERHRGRPDAADVVLATNMISVGVDVDRLGLMVVMGQPQTSSEYIQATSRVGRRRPGLVVTLYNAARSRDLSHYENFTGYHRALYRHVEATGATPFAPRARDRGLHAVLVAMARHTIAGAAADRSAGDAADWEDELRRCRDLIVRRAREIGAEDDGPEDEAPERIAEQLDGLLDRWLDGCPSHYEGWFSRHRGALLRDTSRVRSSRDDDEVGFPPDTPPWPTLTSMREVDAESTVYLVRRRRSSR